MYHDMKYYCDDEQTSTLLVPIESEEYPAEEGIHTVEKKLLSQKEDMPTQSIDKETPIEKIPEKEIENISKLTGIEQVVLKELVKMTEVKYDQVLVDRIKELTGRENLTIYPTLMKLQKECDIHTLKDISLLDDTCVFDVIESKPMKQALNIIWKQSRKEFIDSKENVKQIII
jgi:hypothetical protein